jgi:hypothetical protein
VLIVSYETLRTLQPYLANVEVGLLLCDEGHRLKNGGMRLLDCVEGPDNKLAFQIL